MTGPSALGPWKKAGQSTWSFNNKGPVKKLAIEQGDGSTDVIVFNDKIIGEIQIVAFGADNGPTWSFKAKRITKMVVFSGAVVDSFIFTGLDCNGDLVTSPKIGGTVVSANRTEIELADDEDFTGISGTIGSLANLPAITTLTFHTNKRWYGPYGNASGAPFQMIVPKGTVIGFHGRSNEFTSAFGLFLDL